MDKKQIRSEVLKKRNNLPQEFIKRYSQEIFNILITSPIYTDAQTIMSYMNFKGEVDTGFINNHILKSGKTLVLPKMMEDGGLAGVIYDSSKKFNDDNSFKIKDIDGTYSDIKKIEIIIAAIVTIIVFFSFAEFIDQHWIVIFSACFSFLMFAFGGYYYFRRKQNTIS